MAMSYLFPVLFFAALMSAQTGCRTLPAQPEQKAAKEQPASAGQLQTNAVGPETDLDAAAARLATSFASAPGIRWKKVAVGNLLDPRRQRAALSRSITGALETALAKKSSATGAFVVIKRRDISRTAAEWKLDLTGTSVTPSLKATRTLLGAEVLIAGETATDGRFSRVSLRAVDTSNGTVLWHDDLAVGDETAFTRGAPMDEGKPLLAGSIKVELWSDKDAYDAGHAMTINFKTDHDCYITLIEIDTSGTMRILFPNRFAHENRTVANTTYSVGGKESGYTVPVSGPAGVAIVRAIATPVPVDGPASAGSAVDGIFQSVTHAAAFARELTVQSMVTLPFQQGGNLIRFKVKE
jgi:TolB-like protein